MLRFVFVIFYSVFALLACDSRQEKDKPSLSVKGASSQTVVPYRKGLLWGLYDIGSKNFLVKPQFDFIELGKMPHIFAVSKKGAWGAINALGEIIIPLKYDRLEVRSYYIVAQNKNLAYVFSMRGTPILERVSIIQEITFQEAEDVTRLLIFEQGGKKGVFNVQAGKVIIAANYQEIIAPNPIHHIKYLAVKENEREGFFLYHATEGTLLNTPRFKQVIFGNTSYVIVVNPQNKYGVLDEKGEFTAFFEHKFIQTPLGDSLTAFRAHNNLWGLLHLKSGKIVLKASLRANKTVFNDNFAVVYDKNRVYYVDAKGNKINKAFFQKGGIVQENKAFVQEKNKILLFDLQKNAPFSAEVYDDIPYFSKNPLIVVSQAKNKGVMNPAGKLLIPCKFEKIRIPANNDGIILARNQNGTLYCYDMAGEQILKKSVNFEGVYLAPTAYKHYFEVWRDEKNYHNQNLPASREIFLGYANAETGESYYE